MRKALTLLFVIISVMSLIAAGCDRKMTEIQVRDESGAPVAGAKLIFTNEDGKELETEITDSNGEAVYDEWDDVMFVKVVPPEGFEAVIPEYQEGVKIDSKNKTSIIVLRRKPGTPAVSSTPVKTEVPESTVDDIPADIVPEDTTESAEPYILYSVNALTSFGYNPETETAALIKSYIDRELLLLYKNSDGAARALMQFNTDQAALKAWINEAGSYQAYLVLTRTPDSILRKQQATVYSVDTEKWKKENTSNPPRSSAMSEFEYSFDALWVDKPDDMGSDMVAVWETFGGGLTELSGDTADVPEDTVPYDFIPLGPELGDIWAGSTEIKSLDLIIDTPGGTQMSPGTELVWYGSNAAILFVEKP